MKRKQLEHAIRAACEVAQDTEVYVFGSQAILGQYPNPHSDLVESREVDIVPKNKPEEWNAIDESLGEGSPFDMTFSFYVQGVSLETATLPEGWVDRCIPVRNENTRGHTGLCLEGHDLALSKLAAFRPKDLTFVRVLLREQMVEPDLLMERLDTLPVEPDKREHIRRWILATSSELDP